MNVNLQKKLPGGGNTGSVRSYVYYLGHENRDKTNLGMTADLIPFYDKHNNPVSPDDVVAGIDSNHRHLHSYDAKFFSLILSPSDEEVRCIGKTKAERIEGLKQYVEKVLDQYAKQFGRNNIKGKEDLIYYYTIHEYRIDDDGNLVPGIHVHVVISRNDASGEVKLSPRTNHREGDKGEKAVIKHGFNRNDFYRKCEATFDETFGYLRPVEESFDYRNAMIKGTTEERQAAIKRAVDASGLEDSIRDSLASFAGEMARKAAQEKAAKDEAEKRRMSAEEREKLKRKNMFWNEYHSVYKPEIDRLKSVCEDSFDIYNDIKKRNHAVRAEIDQKYKELRVEFDKIKRIHNGLPGRDDPDEMFGLFLLLIIACNAAALILPLLLLDLFASCREKDTHAEITDIKFRISSIRNEIQQLGEEQRLLDVMKKDALRKALKMNDEKKEFIRTVNNLKEELDKPIPERNALSSLAARYQEYHKLAKTQSPAPVKSAAGLGDELVRVLTRPSSPRAAGMDLAALGIFNFRPVKNDDGYAIDFEMIHHGEVIRASQVCTDRQLAALLSRSQALTGVQHVPVTTQMRTVSEKRQETKYQNKI